jgi:outer membrane lipoprotein-sorting protein
MRLAKTLCIILTVAGASFAQAPTTDQILAKLDEKAKVFQTLEASITMVQVYSGVKTQAESGKLYMKAGKSGPMALMEITSPARSAKTALIKDGKATMYNRSQNTYGDYRVDPNSNAFQLLLTGFGVSAETMKKHYSPQAKGREMVDGVTTEVLDLPLKPDQSGSFKNITLWMDPKTWTPVQIRLTEKSTNTTEYKYSNVRLNKGVSDSVFKWTVPKGAVKQ